MMGTPPAFALAGTRSRLYGWTLLLVITLSGPWLFPKLRALDPLRAVPTWFLSSFCILLIAALSPDAFGLRRGNHRRTWWVYLSYGVVMVVGTLVVSDLFSARLKAAVTRPDAYLITPFEEELLFRGIMYGLLADMYPSSEASRRWFSKPVVFTAILFGLWHVGWIRSIGWAWGLAYVGFTCVDGLVTGYVRRRSGSVLGPIGMHMAWNFMASL